jgi:hypothetical protein
MAELSQNSGHVARLNACHISVFHAVVKGHLEMNVHDMKENFEGKVKYTVVLKHKRVPSVL